jgi:hypothetical protein
MDDTAQPPQLGLSPPWNTLWSKINSTIGADPSFKVRPLRDDGKGHYTVVITVQGGGSDPAALSAILTKSYTMGNITVAVEVDYPEQVVLEINSPESLAQAVRAGLRKNPYFVEAIARPSPPPPAFPSPGVVAVFTRSVIQFFNDDLSDYYRNFNGVTADVFKEVLLPRYPGNLRLGTTTQSSRQGEDGDDSVTPDGGKV